MRGWNKAWSSQETLNQGEEGRSYREEGCGEEEEEEYDGGGFEDKNDQDSTVSDRRFWGRHRGTRNQEDNNLGSIKMKIPSFQGRNDPEEQLPLLLGVDGGDGV